MIGRLAAGIRTIADWHRASAERRLWPRGAHSVIHMNSRSTQKLAAGQPRRRMSLEGTYVDLSTMWNMGTKPVPSAVDRRQARVSLSA